MTSNTSKPPAPRLSGRIQVCVTAAEEAQIRAVAEKERRRVSDWARGVLVRESQQSKGETA
jgi:hypothetical protein